MRLLTILATLPATCALALAAGCSLRLGPNGFGSPDAWAEGKESCSVAAQAIDSVAVVTHNGRIEVVAAAEGVESIEIVADKRAGGDDSVDAAAALSAIVITREVRGRTLEVRSEWAQERRSDWEARVNFTLSVPARFAAHLESHNGDLVAKGLAGSVQLDTHNGAIEIAGVRGRIEAQSHNGRIECCADGQPVALETHNGRIAFSTQATRVSGSIESHNGDIDLDLPSGACGTIVGRGHFSSSDLRGSIAIDGRDFKVELAEPGSARLRVATHNGNVRLR